ncbi:MAG: VWA domain-containing protein [Victivallales bacterium]|nr:VWA domain-containing protein [Victivallales bacterium]
MLMWIKSLPFIILILTLLAAVAVGGKRRRAFKTSFPWDLLCIVGGVGLLAVMYCLENDRANVSTRHPTVFFVVDCSRSMLADDHGVTRLQRAKNIATKIVEEMPKVPVALVSFAGSAFLDLPPTEDREAFRDALAQLAPSLEDLPGSEPAAALKMVETVAMADPQSFAVAILLSDGEIQGGSMDYWEERTIPLVWRCVGLGAPQPIPLGEVWMHDPDTGETALTQASNEKIDACAEMSSAPFSHSFDSMFELNQKPGGQGGFLAIVVVILFLIALRTPTPQLLLLLFLAVIDVNASPLDETATEKHDRAEKIRSELAELPLKSPRRAALLANWAALIADELPHDAILLTQEALRLDPSSTAIRHNLEILEKRLKPKDKQEEMTERQSVADFDELLSLPVEKRREETNTPSSASTVSSPSTPGTWREIKRQNRFIKPRTVKAKPW